MRIFGMFLLGFGIMFLIMSGVALVASGGEIRWVIGLLVCTALVPIPMIVGGIAIIRRVEGAADHAPQWAEMDSAADTDEDPISRYRRQFRNFNLNRLNWIGWLLLFVTFGFVMGEAVVFVKIFEVRDAFWDGRIGKRVIGLAGVSLAVGFFAGMRWLLRVLGISIFRW